MGRAAQKPQANVPSGDGLDYWHGFGGTHVNRAPCCLHSFASPSFSLPERVYSSLQQECVSSGSLQRLKQQPSATLQVGAT